MTNDKEEDIKTSQNGNVQAEKKKNPFNYQNEFRKEAEKYLNRLPEKLKKELIESLEEINRANASQKVDWKDGYVSGLSCFLGFLDGMEEDVRVGTKYTKMHTDGYKARELLRIAAVVDSIAEDLGL